MTKVTLIISTDNENSIEESFRGILNQSGDNLEIICVLDDAIQLQDEYKNVVIKKYTDNQIEVMNDAIINATGEYILFADIGSEIDFKKIEIFYNKILMDKSDVLIFNNLEDNKTMNILSRLCENKVFTYEKIYEYIFDIDKTPFNKLFNRNFLIGNDLFFKNTYYLDELFYFNTLFKAKRLSFMNESVYFSYNNNLSVTDKQLFNEYISNQEDMLSLFKQMGDEEKLIRAFDNYIINLINKYSDLKIANKNEIYPILRHKFIRILKIDENKFLIDNLDMQSRKLFEQVIICESAEEYDLFHKVNEDKKYLNFMGRYKKILTTEEKKIKRFNNSLTSSNSWRLTRIFRL